MSPYQEMIAGILANQTEEHRQRLRIFVRQLPTYRQTTGRLARSDEDGGRSYCCLGVAYEEALKAGLPIDRTDLAETLDGKSSWHYSDREGDTSNTALISSVAQFYGFKVGLAPSNNPLLSLPPTIGPQQCAGVSPHVPGQERRVNATSANDVFKLTLAQIAECFEYTYLRADWEARQAGSSVDVGDGDVAAS